MTILFFLLLLPLHVEEQQKGIMEKANLEGFPIGDDAV